MSGAVFGYYIVTAALAMAGYILYFALTEKPAVAARSAPRAKPVRPEAVVPPLRRAA